MKRRLDPNQILIDWTTPALITRGDDASLRKGEEPASEPLSSSPAPLVQVLPWDFSTSFPQPRDEAIEAGVIDERDRELENLKSLHENYAAQCLATLKALDRVMDARRLGVDPGTGNKPRTHASRERLRRYLAAEPGRLEHTFEILIEAYGNAFGQEAADAFRKAIRSWHAGIEVKGEMAQVLAAQPDSQKTDKHPKRISSLMPVPKPLHAAVVKGVFGHDEKGRPIRPLPDEVREITEDQAERMINGNEAEIGAGVTKYAEDFGERPAQQLEAYVRRQMRDRQR